MNKRKHRIKHYYCCLDCKISNDSNIKPNIFDKFCKFSRVIIIYHEETNYIYPNKGKELKMTTSPCDFESSILKKYDYFKGFLKK